jgi:probable rRNA maturation factor
LSGRRIKVVVQKVSSQPGTPSEALVTQWARHAFGAAAGELVVRIVDADESAALNERYRGKRGATNVLAFPPGDLPDLPGESKPRGDIVICAPVVATEAEQQTKPLLEHWAHMVLHGCLHLQGYDHDNDAAAAVMEARERELLTELGIADPYLASRPD